MTTTLNRISCHRVDWRPNSSILSFLCIETHSRKLWWGSSAWLALGRKHLETKFHTLQETLQVDTALNVDIWPESIKKLGLLYCTSRNFFEGIRSSWIHYLFQYQWRFVIRELQSLPQPWPRFSRVDHQNRSIILLHRIQIMPFSQGAVL